MVLKIEIHDYQHNLRLARPPTSPYALSSYFSSFLGAEVMGKLVVKLIESGIGLTSDAIQAARNRSSNQKSISKSPNQNSPTEPSGQFADEEIARPLVQKERVRLPASTEFRIDQHYAELPAAHEPSIHQEFAELPAVHNQEYAELSAVSESCVHQQYAELPSANEPSTHLEESQQYKSIGAESVVNPMDTSTVIDSGHDLDGYKNSIYSVNIQQGFEQAEAVWTQTESVQNGRLPTYEESEWAPVALARAVETTETQERYSDQPAIANEQPVDRSGGLTCRIVIPQFMPRTETSINERPYAPVLANYGICQDMFSRFLEDLEQANMVRYAHAPTSPHSRLSNSNGGFRVQSGSTLLASQRIYQIRSQR
jgi:hypothetical protein